MVFDFLDEEVGGMYAYFAPDGFSVLEHYECGDGADVVAVGKFAVAVDVDFYDVGHVAYLFFRFFKHGGLHFAGAAPCGEEVDERGAVFVDEFFKIGHSYSCVNWRNK